MKEFSKNLKRLRKQTGYTQEQMAEKLSISYNQYKNYEQGVSEPPLENLTTICKILNVPVDYLLSNKDRMFQDYASTVLFNEIRKMDDDESKSIFYTLQKLIELKNITEQLTEEDIEEESEKEL